jgi:multidrug efflux pump
MFSRFFIDRPILASVPSILITLLGIVALYSLPISQYPDITPPTVQVTCMYPGANAEVMADTIAAPIEQQVNGVENMLFMSSQNGSDGSYTLTVTFKVGTDLNMAQVLVQNRVALATPKLPEVVQQLGITVKKNSPDMLFLIDLYSPDQRYDSLYIKNYARIQICDALARVDGVGDILVFGPKDYSMRVWLSPDRLTACGITASDIVRALREQNVQVAAGQLGQEPAQHDTNFQYTISTLGRLREPSQFGDIIIKTGDDGQVVRIRDVARIELGAQTQDSNSFLDGMPTGDIGVFQLPGSNALATAKRVKAKMQELAKNFPDGLSYVIRYDTTPYIEESIHEVLETLAIAVGLVAIVVLVFLQDWRPAIIPLLAVPVAIVGTFAAMAVLGFSLNTLSLFGLVLAIGIVVDNAIVIVEATEHHISQGMMPVDAAKKTMEEVSSPVVAIGLVLTCVFMPCLFITGISGLFFRQFALTIATSTVLSTFNALTLCPALCGVLLKPRGAHRDFLSQILHFLLGWFFASFNKVFSWLITGYTGIVGVLLRLSVLIIPVYAGLLCLTAWSFNKMPTGFIPMQDQGYLLAAIQLPDSASLKRTEEVALQVSEITQKTPGVDHTIAVTGQSFVLGANGSHLATMFIVLKPFEDRRSPDLTANAIADKLRGKLYQKIQDANIAVFGAPPIRGLGNAGGFKLMIEDRGNEGLPNLQKQTDDLIALGNQGGNGLVGLFSLFRANTPQLYIDIDRTKCKTMNLAVNDVFDTLQIELGGLYVNDINLFGRTWQVNAQADSPYRMHAQDMRRLQIRNANGEMVPLSAVSTIKPIGGPFTITRYNMYPATSISGDSLPGVSSGDVIAKMEEMANEHLPHTMGYEWTDIYYMQIIAGNSTLFVFAGAVVLVFLVLAGQYERWSLPLAVILVVPMCILCSITGLAIAGMEINIFTQIGFVVLVGLASNNAILIVEFAKSKREEGMPRYEATVEACRLRLRPIMMTASAFILGVVPLVISRGAGAEMRNALGTAVFSGMLGVTVFGLLLTPVFFYVIQYFKDRNITETPSTPTIVEDAQ